jgi:hypothetical protein
MRHIDAAQNSRDLTFKTTISGSGVTHSKLALSFRDRANVRNPFLASRGTTRIFTFLWKEA